jgi:outer membrane protein TolC
MMTTHHITTPRALRRTLLCLSMACSAGASLAAPPDAGVAGLQTSMHNRVVGVAPGEVLLPHPALDATAQVNALLQTPLSADAAVRIAVLNNPDLQLALGAAGLSITDALGADSPAKFQARQAMTVLSAQAYKAWISAVAAEQSARLWQDAKDTLQTTGELTRRMAQVGNVAKLTQARAQLALSEAAINLARARTFAFAARENLIVTLGLWGAQTQFQLPADLPALPENARDIPNVEALALQARTDLELARSQWQRKQATTVPTDANGLWEAFGDAAKVRGSAVRVRSQARDAYMAYRTAFDIARHWQTEVLPLRGFVHDEMVLRYNGMLTSLFDVLADSEARTQATNAAVAAQRDFWLADADLQALLAGAPIPMSKETP